MYFVVNLKSCHERFLNWVSHRSCHARVLNWVIQENICQVELAQYGIFLYWASSTGHIFSRISQLRTLAWQLSEFTKGFFTEVLPHKLSRYKNPSNMAMNFSMYHMLWRNLECRQILLAHPAGEHLVCQPTESRANGMPYPAASSQNHRSLFDINI